MRISHYSLHIINESESHKKITAVKIERKTMISSNGFLRNSIFVYIFFHQQTHTTDAITSLLFLKQLAMDNKIIAF